MKEESKKTSMSPMMIIGVLGALLLGGIVIYAATGTSPAKPKDNAQYKNEGAMEDEDEKAEELNESEEGVEVVEVEAGSFYFKPNEIEVEKGDTVKIKFTAMDGMHDFVIDELNVRTEIVKSGDMGEVEFVASKEGTFEFYCSVGDHRTRGMVGTLIVEE